MHAIFGGLGLVALVLGLFALLFAGCAWLIVDRPDSGRDAKYPASLTGWAFILLVVGVVFYGLSQLP